MASTTTTTRDTPARGTRHSHEPSPQRATDAEIEAARADIARAFQVLGLAAGGNPVCPECGASDKGKVKLFSDGGWHCYKRGHHGKKFGALDLLMERGGYSFAEALALQLGRPVSRRSSYTPPKELPDIASASDFTAVVDCDVYDAILAGSSFEAAVKFYGQWFISPDAVAEVGCRIAENPKQLIAELTSQFGRDRLVAAGVVMPGEETASGRDWALLTADYPVIEPYLRPDGRCVGMQFRASAAHAEKVRGYPAAKAAYDEAKAAYEAAHGDGSYRKKAPRFVPKFLSLRGAGPDSLIGGGVRRIATLEPGQRIHIVEGPKDLLAARTLGVEAYSVSGVGDMPPAKVCRILARHLAVIRLDGDEAGLEGVERLKAHFDEHHVPWEHKPMPDGMDVTDILVEKMSALAS